MGPCDWEILPTCSDWVANPTPGSAQERNQERAEEVAKFLLWSWTAKLFGVCEHTLRPCFRPPDNSTTYRGREGGAGPSFWPGLIQGTWVNGACGCRADCRCIIPDSMLALPGPVVSVTEVREDGVVLDPSAYRIRNGRWLMRIGGSWPQEQDLEAADNAPGAFVVTYRKGIPLPKAGQYAAGDLACEILRGISGGACALPARAVSVARQGVDIQLLDPAQYLDAGLTGIPSVDAFIKAVNPGRARSRPRVFNPDEMGRNSRIRPGA